MCPHHSLNWVQRWWKSKRVPARRSVRLELEALETRLTPTIVFQPHFGPETTSGFNGAVQNPDVFVIFWGNYWGQPQGIIDKDNMLQAAKSILGSSYLQGEIQYGGDGKATFGATWTDTSNPPPSFTNANLQNFLENTINGDSPIPRPDTPPANHIYVVVTDPNATSNAANAIGYNTQLCYEPPGILPDCQTEQVIWASSSFTNGVGTPINMRTFTEVFSHELAENVSEPGSGISVTPPPGLPAPLNPPNSNQIADYEPESLRYGYPLNGFVVQPYWSRQAYLDAPQGAFIVTDGTHQQFILSPNWSGSTFTQNGGYALTIEGDQLGANYADNIVVDKDAAGGVIVTLNGEVAHFEPNVISSITINGYGGADHIEINNLASNVSVTVNENSTSTVLIGNAPLGAGQAVQGSITIYSAGSVTIGTGLSTVAGSVIVNNATNVSIGRGRADFVSGQVTIHSPNVLTALTVDDHLDPTGRNFDVVPTGVSNAVNVTYDTGRVNSLTLLGGTGTTGPNNFFVGNGYPLEQLPKNITISGGGADALYVDGSTSSPNDYRITNNSISAYQDADFRQFLIDQIAYSGLASIYVQGNNTNNTSFSISSTAAGTPVNISEGTGSVNTVTVGSSTAGLDGINGAVNVSGTISSLTIDNAQASASHAFILDRNYVQRTDKARINYAGVVGLNLTAHSDATDLSGDSITVQDTMPGATTINNVDGVDSVFVQKTSGPLAIDAGGSSFITVGNNLSNIQGNVTINLTGNSVSLFLVDTAATAPRQLDSTASASGTTFQASGASSIQVLGQLLQFQWTGGSGGNTIRAHGRPAPASTFTLGAGNDSLYLSSSTTGHQISNLGNLIISSGGGADFVFLDDSDETSVQNYNVSLRRGRVEDFSTQGSNLILGGDGNAVPTLVLSGSSSGNNTLDGPISNALFRLSARNAGNLTFAFGTTTFTGVQNLTGASGADDFLFADGAGVDGNISDTGGSENTLDYSAYSTPVTVDLSRATATGVGGSISNIGTLSGGQSDDSLTGNATGTTIFYASPGNDTLTAAGGTNTLIGTNAASTWNITAQNSGTFTFGTSTTTFSGVQNLSGGSAADDFVLADGTGVDGSINGGGGSNTLDESAYSTPVRVNLAGFNATGVGSAIMNLQSFIGSSGGGNDLTSQPFFGTPFTWRLTGPNTGSLTVGAVTWAFAGFQNLDAIGGHSTFIVSDGAGVDGNITAGGGTNVLDESAYSTPVTVDLTSDTATGVGGTFSGLNSFIGSAAGGNSLNGPNANTTWNLSGSDAGTLTGGINFTAFGNLNGGSASNVFILAAGAVVDGSINGGSGSNTLVGPNAANTWSLSAQNAGTLSGGATANFSGVQNLTGGSAADDFVLADGTGVDGAINGGGGSNTLDESAYTSSVAVDLSANAATGVGSTFANVQNFIGSTGGGNSLNGPNANTTWNITAQNAGSLSGGINFSAFQNLTGGLGVDAFLFANGVGVDGNLDGGGTNTLNESAYTTPVAVDLSATTATGVGGNIANLQNFIGGSGGGNSLNGPDANTTWNLSGHNAGTLSGGFSFTAFGNLTGGAGNNTFFIPPGASVDGIITGGGGTNDLNYGSYAGNVLVDLQTGTATGVAGGVANIQNVEGNSAGAPDSFYNILVGNGGNVLTGGSDQFNLLIAGGSASTLLGGSANDILIGGTTDYDTNLTALLDIMSVWTSADSYANRVARLVDDPTYAYSLNASTVYSNGGGNTLTGKPGGSTALDLYFANLGAGDSTDAGAEDRLVGIS